jgi:hypothetical protein
VEVADAAVGRFVDFLAVALDPVEVAKVRLVGDGLEFDGACALVAASSSPSMARM